MKLKDNTQYTPEVLTEQEISVLSEIGNCYLSKLVENNSGLLIFPHCLGANGDDINKQKIFSFDGKTIYPGNVVGFCGKNGVNIRIHSRFDSGEKQYFLHYMLQKVFGINMLNLPTSTEDENIWDFLLYLFPYSLKKALRQGLFRAYRSFRYNDDKVKGAIDIPAHIKQNIPFTGRIAYQTREHTANNYLIHLVRHTIEAIRRHPFAGQMLSNDQEIRQCVEVINESTPDFNPHALNRIIQKNLRQVRHPFYTEYTLLQQLCMKILRHERLTYGEDDKQIHGILFEASWLWEEYLNTVLYPLDFKHPQNKTGKGGLDFYTDGYSYKGAFPDFYNDNWKIVIDAKYKPLNSRQKKDLRDDRFQLISYMHIQAAKTGLLMYPTSAENETPIWEGRLRGYGGNVGIYGFQIPSYADMHKFAQFSDGMVLIGNNMVKQLKEISAVDFSLPEKR